MTEPHEFERRPPGPGLRVRLWLGCIAGSLVAAAALSVLLARESSMLDGLSGEFRWVWLPGILGAAVVLSIGLAIWLDRGIVRHLRGLSRGLGAGDPSDLRGLPSVAGWGELSALTTQAQALLARQRQSARAGAELEDVSARIIALRDAIERWSRSGVWESLPPGHGAMGPLVGILNREFSRIGDLRGAGREFSAALEGEVAAGLTEAREIAEQAERGFVEATALITTVRELERLGGELDTVIGTTRAGEGERSRVSREALDAFRGAATEAISRLVTASGESVTHLAEGLLRVQEIADRTRVISNRATLIALNVLSAGSRSSESPLPAQSADELKALARDVREASEAVIALSAEIERAAAAARGRMAEVRTSVSDSLETALHDAERVTAAEPPADASRLLERIREMIRDATAKGERLSAAGERASRAAAKLQRRVESEAATIQRLTSALAADASAPESGPSGPSGPAGPLRVIERQAPAGEGEAAPTSARRPREERGERP